MALNSTFFLNFMTAAFSFVYSLLRLEFDHSLLDYFTEIDAVLFTGSRVSFKNNAVIFSFIGLSDDMESSENESSCDSSNDIVPWIPSKPVTDLTTNLIKRNIHIIPSQVIQVCVNLLQK